jgi:hypothetical protein
MTTDGGLRPLFRQQFRQWQWTSVETAYSASGVPDSEFCTPRGITGWVEFKKTHIWHVQIKPFQIAWLMRRCRYGGNAWIAVRRMHKSGADELWLMKGDQAEALHYNGLEAVEAWMWEGGPSQWNFPEIGNMLSCFTS